MPLFGKTRRKIVKGKKTSSNLDFVLETSNKKILNNLDVLRARAGYGAAREKNAQLREALSAANTVMAENMTQMVVMALMFDLMADGNPALAKMWYVKT